MSILMKEHRSTKINFVWFCFICCFQFVIAFWRFRRKISYIAVSQSVKYSSLMVRTLVGHYSHSTSFSSHATWTFIVYSIFDGWQYDKIDNQYICQVTRWLSIVLYLLACEQIFCVWCLTLEMWRRDCHSFFQKIFYSN